VAKSVIEAVCCAGRTGWLAHYPGGHWRAGGCLAIVEISRLKLAVASALRDLFDGDLRRQDMKLLMMFALIMRSLHAPEDLRDPLRDIGIKHAGYGVQLEHYMPFGNALLRMLKDTLGAEYTPELHDAWTEALRMLTRIMTESTYEKETGQRA